MAPQRSVSIDRLWQDFLTAFPNKDRSSDGWIGDKAHQAETSGHNPDDTSGVSAERQDLDTKQEVRAIDEDSDLRDPRGITMQQVIDRLLQTPNDLKRLIYIIFNRQIWRKSNGWTRETYNGASPHTEHGHFSGDPAFDEDGSEWKSVTSFKEKGILMALSDVQQQDLWEWLALLVDPNTPATGRPSDRFHFPPKVMQAALAPSKITQEMLNDAMVFALQQPTVLAALGPIIRSNAFEAAQQAEKE